MPWVIESVTARDTAAEASRERKVNCTSHPKNWPITPSPRALLSLLVEQQRMTGVNLVFRIDRGRLFLLGRHSPSPFQASAIPHPSIRLRHTSAEHHLSHELEKSGRRPARSPLAPPRLRVHHRPCPARTIKPALNTNNRHQPKKTAPQRSSRRETWNSPLFGSPREAARLFLPDCGLHVAAARGQNFCSPSTPRPSLQQNSSL